MLVSFILFITFACYSTVLEYAKKQAKTACKYTFLKVIYLQNMESK
jgi:hypothetical protein